MCTRRTYIFLYSLNAFTTLMADPYPRYRRFQIVKGIGSTLAVHLALLKTGQLALSMPVIKGYLGIKWYCNCTELLSVVVTMGLQCFWPLWTGGRLF